MAVLQRAIPQGRNFTADELVGRQIRIEGPVPKKDDLPTGRTVRVIADGEEVNNAFKAEITLAATELTQAKIWLYRFDLAGAEVPIEEITLRDNIELSFSAIVSEVQ